MTDDLRSADQDKKFGVQPVWALRRYAAAVIDAFFAATIGQLAAVACSMLIGGNWARLMIWFWLGAIIGYVIWSERRPGHVSVGKMLLGFRLEPDEVGVSLVWVVLIRGFQRVLALLTIIVAGVLMVSEWFGSAGESMEAQANMAFAGWLTGVTPILVLFFIALLVRGGLSGQTVYDRLCGLRPVSGSDG